MPHGLILKVTKFLLPPNKRLGHSGQKHFGGQEMDKKPKGRIPVSATEYLSSQLIGCKYCTSSETFPVSPRVYKAPDPFGAFLIRILISLYFIRYKSGFSCHHYRLLFL